MKLWRGWRWRAARRGTERGGRRRPPAHSGRERAGDPSATESVHAALALADDHAGLSHARCSPTRRRPPHPPSTVFLTFAWVRTSLPLGWKSHKWRIGKARFNEFLHRFMTLEGLGPGDDFHMGLKNRRPQKENAHSSSVFWSPRLCHQDVGREQATHRLTTHLIAESTS